MVEHLHRVKAPAITANHALLTEAWTAEVKSLVMALGRIKLDARSARSVSSNCRVTFFEVAGDQHLHVNVTHQSATETIKGWSGPGTTSDGTVHNRTFSRMPRYQVLRQIKDMIFAAPA